MAPHSSTLAWKNPMDGVAWWVQPMGSLRVGTTERLDFHFSLSCIGEGNGNPLPCSFLENPRDGGAWWAAVYGVTQSQTRLKRLSSNSSSTSARMRTQGKHCLKVPGGAFFTGSHSFPWHEIWLTWFDLGNRLNWLPRWLSGKESTCQCRRCHKRQFNPWVGKIPWRKKWHLTPVFLPGKFHGQKSLAGYNPKGRKELDTTEATECNKLSKRVLYHVLLFGTKCLAGVSTKPRNSKQKKWPLER